MLQWMGGSRKKITTSRKTIQRRQKQYFEQRRRQCYQTTVGPECHGDSFGRNSKDTGSLDVHSLLYFSDNDRGKQIAKRNEDERANAQKSDAHLTPYALSIDTNVGFPLDSSHEKLEEGTRNSPKEERIFTKKDAVCADMVANTSCDLNAKSFIDASFMELLNHDDEACQCKQQSVSKEVHASLAMEGSSKVEEIPSLFQQQRSRHGSYESVHIKAPMQSIPAVHLEMDSMFNDIMTPQYGSLLSTETYDPRNKLNKNKCSLGNWLHFGVDDSCLEDCLHLDVGIVNSCNSSAHNGIHKINDCAFKFGDTFLESNFFDRGSYGCEDSCPSDIQYGSEDSLSTAANSRHIDMLYSNPPRRSSFSEDVFCNQQFHNSVCLGGISHVGNLSYEPRGDPCPREPNVMHALEDVQRGSGLDDIFVLPSFHMHEMDSNDTSLGAGSTFRCPDFCNLDSLHLDYHNSAADILTSGFVERVPGFSEKFQWDEKLPDYLHASHSCDRLFVDSENSTCETKSEQPELQPNYEKLLVVDGITIVRSTEVMAKSRAHMGYEYTDVNGSALDMLSSSSSTKMQ